MRGREKGEGREREKRGKERGGEGKREVNRARGKKKREG